MRITDVSEQHIREQGDAGQDQLRPYSEPS